MLPKQFLIPIAFHRIKHIMEVNRYQKVPNSLVWTNLRVSKLWQNFHFWMNGPFNLNFFLYLLANQHHPSVKPSMVLNLCEPSNVFNIVWISVPRAGGTVCSSPYCPSHWTSFYPALIFTQSSQSNHPCHLKPPRRNSSTETPICYLCSLHHSQTLTDPMSHSLTVKSHFSKVPN